MKNLQFQSALRPVSLLVMLLSLTACVPSTPQWDSQFGETVRLTRSQQTLYPEAGGDAPVNGIDGVSGRQTIDRYRNTFKEPPPPLNSFTIGVGH